MFTQNEYLVLVNLFKGILHPQILSILQKSLKYSEICSITKDKFHVIVL